MQTRERVGVGEFETHGGKTVEKQLADVGEKRSLAGRDAVARCEIEDLAEGVIDRSGGAEVFNAVEEAVGKAFGFALMQACVVGAKRIVVPSTEHTAAVVVLGDEAAVFFCVYERGLWLGRHGVFLCGRGS